MPTEKEREKWARQKRNQRANRAQPAQEEEEEGNPLDIANQ